MSVTITEKHGANEISVVQIHGGDGDGAEIVLELNGKFIAVSIFPNHSTHNDHNGECENLAEGHLIDLLSRAATDCFGDDDDDDDEYDNIINRVLDIILSAGGPIFTEVAPSPTLGLSTQTLYSLLHPETVHFRFKTEHGKQLLVPIKASEAYASSELQPDDNIDSDFLINGELPVYSSREIYILEAFVGRGAVSRVLVDGQEMLCKAHATGLFDLNLQQELTTLLKIEKSLSTTSRTIQVPRLCGYVEDAERGCIVGLLRQWIPPAAFGGKLGRINITTISRGRREKWATQIRETVDQLHEIGVIWGDGKASNIIIDDQDNAWLIDFGGGWTEGWVDKEVADTVEGDEQAVNSIVNFLGVGRAGT
ncbi:Protein kinase domain-containing protein [Cladophialophora immunda]|nr:Protein kinase domain-containing protein [Cladophialophora immunda]